MRREPAPEAGWSESRVRQYLYGARHVPRRFGERESPPLRRGALKFVPRQFEKVFLAAVLDSVHGETWKILDDELRAGCEELLLRAEMRRLAGSSEPLGVDRRDEGVALVYAAPARAATASDRQARRLARPPAAAPSAP